MSEAPLTIARRNRLLRELAYDSLYRDETGSSATCRDCGVRFAPKPWYRVRTVGHNIPLARVQEHETRDLVRYDQCAGCNVEQGTRTPDEWHADRRAALPEPIGEITDEQRRIRERVRWEKAWRRKRPARDRPALAEVPGHLLSHEETLTLFLSLTRAEIARLPGIIEGHEKELAVRERQLAYLRTKPTVVRHLFGLVRRLDHAGAAALATCERSVEAARQVLERDRAHLAAAKDTARDVKTEDRLSDCGCVACAGDYEERAERYREERVHARKAAWHALRSPRPRARPPYRAWWR
ncbi:MAG TPA: hypothetical protein VNE21_08240 [Mycobacteriales bacterium]|nr:hypothetical protein [Mycobacteriales bacterium]